VFINLKGRTGELNPTNWIVQYGHLKIRWFIELKISITQNCFWAKFILWINFRIKKQKSPPWAGKSPFGRPLGG